MDDLRESEHNGTFDSAFGESVICKKKVWKNCEGGLLILQAL